MQVKTKQRIIGLLVLLAILAIFLPLLFHNSDPSTHAESIAIPAKPNVAFESPKTEIVLQKPEAPSSVAVAEKSEPVTQAAQPTPAALTSAPPQAASTPPPPTTAPTTEIPTPPAAESASTPQQPIAAVAPSPANLQQHKAQVISQQKGLSKFMAEPNAWCVQLGTFSDIAHANALLELLRKKGFDAYTRPIVNVKGSHLLRVYVGPEVRQESALQLRDKLEASVHMKGIVQKYEIKT